jgi:hypothetical protein
MRRFAASMALALALATLGAAGTAAAGPRPNANADYVQLDCTNGTQVIWVNFLASDLADGGVPAIVVDGGAGRVYKVMSVSVGGETFFTRLPDQLPFDPVVCTHDSPYGLVTLTGVFIP